ncbi:MAG: HAD-IIB family hydrolase [Gammaproteobacteria bacterium]|nr:HAD-IIB family hydrolase [Gammaproteobacteria bacterium]
MREPQLLLCADMDRTVIPNGAQSEHSQARKQFAEFCSQPQVTLVYVTGRHQQLVKQAIKNYSLPWPRYAITDVGTKIYRIVDQQWQLLQAWENVIEKDWNGKSHGQIKALFDDISDLQPQESGKQNTHKLSYYVSLHVKQADLLSLMAQRVKEVGVQASLVWSVDEPKDIGLLDVLPENATKLHAIDFLRQQLGLLRDEVVFAGDSGNDLPVLGSAIPSVLVANAAEDVRESALRLTQRNGTHQALYLATGNNAHMNGNYSAGVLEGVCYFVPAFREQLKQSGFCCEQ